MQIESTQATQIDLFNGGAGLDIRNTDDIEQVSNYMTAFLFARESLRAEDGLPINIRLSSGAHQLLFNGI